MIAHLMGRGVSLPDPLRPVVDQVTGISVHQGAVACLVARSPSLFPGVQRAFGRSDLVVRLAAEG